MARKKTSAVALARTINVRVPTELDGEVRQACRTYDLSASHLIRKAIRHFLQTIKGKDHLYQEIGT